MKLWSGVKDIAIICGASLITAILVLIILLRLAFISITRMMHYILNSFGINSLNYLKIFRKHADKKTHQIDIEAARSEFRYFLQHKINTPDLQKSVDLWNEIVECIPYSVKTTTLKDPLSFAIENSTDIWYYEKVYISGFAESAIFHFRSLEDATHFKLMWN